MNIDLSQLGVGLGEVGVIIVDHGSRRDESNQLLLEVVETFRSHSDWSIVEPAHMELAEPSIATAFGRCVDQGAKLIVVFPYFLSPGRHWSKDIPALSASAAKAYPDIKHLVTAPLGLHALMMQVINERIAHCLQHSTSAGPSCNVCDETTGCKLTEPA